MARPKATDVRTLEVVVQFTELAYRMPLKFGGRLMDQTTVAEATVRVETRDGREATGYGSMPLGNVWAWPSTVTDPAQTCAAMKNFAVKAADLFESFADFGHPLEISYNVGADFHFQSGRVAQASGVAEPMPVLAQLVAASSVDAALHDAYGRVHRRSSFSLLGSEHCNQDLSSFLDDQFAGEFAQQYINEKPVERLPLYHLVGAADPLTAGDVSERPDDGLPVTLGEWIAADGLTHLKIKLAGDDADWDVNRVLSVDRAAAEAQAARQCSQWHYSVDFNEKCESAEYVLSFLARVREQSPAAFDRIQYIEQPTSRNLEAASAARMHEVAAVKPVVIDEALTDYEALLACRELGYSGVALKACKGQTESILAAAAAQKFGMFLCVQDLTCPGASFLHSCSLAAHIPGIAAIEGNGRQYCPSGNGRWPKYYPGIFEITDGTVQTDRLSGIGLGYQLPEWTTSDRRRDVSSEEDEEAGVVRTRSRSTGSPRNREDDE